MNIYCDVKQSSQPDMWVLLLTEWVVRLAKCKGETGKSNSYRRCLQKSGAWLHC